MNLSDSTLEELKKRAKETAEECSEWVECTSNFTEGLTPIVLSALREAFEMGYREGVEKSAKKCEILVAVDDPCGKRILTAHSATMENILALLEEKRGK